MDEPHILVGQEEVKKPKGKFPGFSKVFSNFDHITPQHRLILLLITLVIILVVVINYLREPEKYKSSQSQQTLTQTQVSDNKAPDWKTYINSGCGYQINYPPSWNQDVYDDGYVEIILFTSNDFEGQLSIPSTYLKNGNGFAISCDPNMKVATTLSTLVEMCENNIEFHDNKSCITTTFGELTAIKTDQHVYFATANLGKTRYTLDLPKLNNETNQILSTFKFLEEY